MITPEQARRISKENKNGMLHIENSIEESAKAGLFEWFSYTPLNKEHHAKLTEMGFEVKTTKEYSIISW